MLSFWKDERGGGRSHLPKRGLCREEKADRGGHGPSQRRGGWGPTLSGKEEGAGGRPPVLVRIARCPPPRQESVADSGNLDPLRERQQRPLSTCDRKERRRGRACAKGSYRSLQEGRCGR